MLLSVFKKWRDGKGFQVLTSLTSSSDYLVLIEGLKPACEVEYLTPVGAGFDPADVLELEFVS